MKKQVYEIELKKTMKVTEEDIKDMLCGLESAIDYWGEICYQPTEYQKIKIALTTDELVPPCYEDVLFELIKDEKVKIWDREDDTYISLNLEKILKGFELWQIQGYDRYDVLLVNGTLDMCDFDGEMCDAVVQCACYGDIIYG